MVPMVCISNESISFCFSKFRFLEKCVTFVMRLCDMSQLIVSLSMIAITSQWMSILCLFNSKYTFKWTTLFYVFNLVICYRNIEKKRWFLSRLISFPRLPCPISDILIHLNYIHTHTIFCCCRFVTLKSIKSNKLITSHTHVIFLAVSKLGKWTPNKKKQNNNLKRAQRLGHTHTHTQRKLNI